ncbi:carbohydrate ABC transporter permease [Paenibacillus alkaliterrae]|uniref:carbohydrate ABC transporter permease n=2 Tax=Paenibacillus alkaliterrae TaxID=320909 RepID=UPI0039EF6685
MCNVLEVSRSGYYKWRDRPESAQDVQHKEWTAQVKEVYEKSRKLYGSPKITQKMEEASLIDGCTRRQTFFKIVLPMLAPTSMTIAILNVLWIWNDYLLPSLILNDEKNYTMPIKMKVFNGTYMNNWELLIPAILMTILPILITYLIGQRFIIKGISQGAIK